MSNQSAGELAQDEFDAAKIIVEAVRDLDGPKRELALRFASESLGLQPPSGRRGEPASPGSAAAQSLPPAVVHPGKRTMDIKQFVES